MTKAGYSIFWQQYIIKIMICQAISSGIFALIELDRLFVEMKRNGKGEKIFHPFPCLHKRVSGLKPTSPRPEQGPTRQEPAPDFPA